MKRARLEVLLAPGPETFRAGYIPARDRVTAPPADSSRTRDAPLARIGARAGLLAQDQPYADPSRHARTYEGPGREEPDPTGLREVLIGYFGPVDPSHPVGGMLWQGASLAIRRMPTAPEAIAACRSACCPSGRNPWQGGPAQLVHAV